LSKSILRESSMLVLSVNRLVDWWRHLVQLTWIEYLLLRELRLCLTAQSQGRLQVRKHWANLL
jgi:hypothetical protein